MARRAQGGGILFMNTCPNACKTNGLWVVVGKVAKGHCFKERQMRGQAAGARSQGAENVEYKLSPCKGDLEVEMRVKSIA